MWDGNTGYLIVGNNWPSVNWSYDTSINNEQDLNPATPIAFGTWHTMVERIDYLAGQNATVKIWLDPDFTQTEANQPTAPVTISTVDIFDSIQLRVGNGTTSATFSNIIMAATTTGAGFAVPAAPQFQDLFPTAGSIDVLDTTPIGGQVAVGGSPINNSAVVFKLDGSTVAPTVGQASGIISVNYTPASKLADGTVHTAQLIVTDNNNNSYTNTWSFTTAFATLPAVLPGPFSTSNVVDLVIFSTNDAWIGANYGASSSKTLFVTYLMEFNDTNDTGGVTWGGLDFFQDGNEKLLVGKNGGSPNWSVANAGANAGDIPPTVMVQTNDWHKFVVRVDYSPGGQATANIWLDPDLTQPQISQPNSPLTLTLDNTFDNIRLRCGFNDAMDTFSNIVVSSASPFAAGGPATFQGYVPGQNASSALISSPISVDVVFGSYGISTNTIVLNVDGTNVTPSFVVTASSITVNYQPPNPFAPGSPHTATVSLTDSNGTPYSTSWSFTADQYPSLPLTQAGPLYAYTGSDVILYDAQNGWIGGNYGPSSTNTLYASFSMTFYDLNGKTDNGGAFGGLEFYLGNTEHLLIGDNYFSTNWSVAVDTLAAGDLPPVTPIVLGDWHTMLMKCVYAGTNDTIKIWLDPDFTKAENNQPNAPLQLTMDNTFDNIHLRAGNGSAQASFTNIVFAATAVGVGLPAATVPAVLTLGPVNGHLQLSWTGTGTLLAAPAVTGPWSAAGNQNNPQTVSTVDAAQFFRLQQ